MYHNVYRPLTRTVDGRAVLPLIEASVADLERLLRASLDPEERAELERELLGSKELRDYVTAFPTMPVEVSISVVDVARLTVAVKGLPLS